MKALFLRLILIVFAGVNVLDSSFTDRNVLLCVIMSALAMLHYLSRQPYQKQIMFIIYCTLTLFEPLLIWGFPLLAFEWDNLLSLIPFLLSVLFYPVLKDAFLVSMIVIFVYAGSFHLRKSEAMDLELTRFKDERRQYELDVEEQRRQMFVRQQQDVEVAMLNERNRIARDIHDNVGHLLSSALLQIGALQATDKTEQNQQSYALLKSTLDQGMTSIRSSVHQLYANSVNLDYEIAAILESLSSQQVFYKNDFETIPSNEVKSVLIFIIKEAVNNILKHSNAEKVWIRLSELEQHYVCIIEDNGNVVSQHYKQGVGLMSMEKRVSILKGYFNVQHEPGFRVYARLPKENSDENNTD